MKFGPKTLWVMHLIMVVITGTLLVYDPADINPVLGKIVFKGLLISYMVLGFLTNGIMPPAPTQIPKV